MATKEAAERACKEPNPIIDGRKANVNLAILGAKPRLNSLQGKKKAANISWFQPINLDNEGQSFESVRLRKDLKICFSK